MRRALAIVSTLIFIVPVLVSPRAWAQAGPRIHTVRDAETESMVRAFANPLFRTAGVDPARVRITLIQNWAINAFVTPGNRLYIHTGLIQQSGQALEFAGVLAHETGHIAAGHLTRLPEEMRAAVLRSAAAMLLGGAAAALGGGRSGLGQAGMGLALGGQQMAQSQFLAFTRAQEQAADQAALTYMERLGWSPRGLAALLERMVLQENIASSRQDPYFRTHPLTRDRLEFVRDGLGRSPQASATLPAALEIRFVMARAKLDGFLDNPQTTFRRLPESDTSAPARYARAIAHFRSGRIADSVALLDRLIREQPLNPYLHELKGQVLLEGQRPRDAVAPYREAVRLAPQEPLIRLNHARLLIELGDPASLRLAVRELETSLAGERDSAFAWRQLAMAQGRLGNNALADLALAEAAVLNGEFADARRFAARAEAALPAGPQRLRAQDLRFAARRDNMTPDDRALEDRMRRGGR